MFLNMDIMLQSQVSGISAATYSYDDGKIVNFNLFMSIIILCVQQLCNKHGERELFNYPTPVNVQIWSSFIWFTH